jgi:hypothetical protein
MSIAKVSTFRVCLLSLAIVGFLPQSGGQSVSEKAIYYRLSIKGPDSIKALDEVLNRSADYSALVLYQASAVAVVNSRDEDSGFLFFAAQIRAPFDKAAFPALSKDVKDYAGAFAMLRALIGAKLMPKLYETPKTFENALDRIDSWSPKTAKDYEPGWKYISRVDGETATAAISGNRAQFMKQMHGYCTLLKNDQYRAAFRTAQDNNPTTIREGDSAPTQEEFETAIGTMKRIENESKIAGVSGQFKA